MTTHEFITLESRRIRENDPEEEVSIEERGSGDEIPPPVMDELSEHGTKSIDLDHRRRRPSIQSIYLNDIALVAKIARERSNSPYFPELHESPPEWAISEVNYGSKENKKTFDYEVGDYTIKPP